MASAVNEVGKVAIKLTLTGQKEVVKDAQQTGKEVASTLGSELGVIGKAGSLMNTLTDGIITAATSTVKTVSKIAIGTAATTLTTIGTMSAKQYAEYEQSLGGIRTLYGDASAQIEEFAKNAYKTAQVSTNEYMKQATLFSARLIQATGGDLKKAAELTDQAMRDMADNSNKMGTSLKSLQNAYQGFARGQFGMLDNLMIGYGGTASEMARLINDTKVLGDEIAVDAKTVKDVPFDKIIEAIHIVQTELKITGATAQESFSTVQGSFRMTKAALENLITGFADPEANLVELSTAFVESASYFASNMIPLIGKIVGSIAEMLPRIIDELMDSFDEFLNYDFLKRATDSILSAVLTLATDLISKATVIIPRLLQSLFEVLPKILDGLPKMFDQIVELGNAVLDILIDNLPELFSKFAVKFSNGVGNMLTKSILPAIRRICENILPNFIHGIVLIATEQLPYVFETFGTVAQMLPEILPELLEGFNTLLTEFISYLPTYLPIFINSLLEMALQIVDALPTILDTIVQGIMTIVQILVQPENLTRIIEAGVELLLALLNALPIVLQALTDALPQIIDSLCEFFLDIDNQKRIMDAFFKLLVGLGGVIPRILGVLFEGFYQLFKTLWERLKTTFGEFAGIVGRTFTDLFKGAFNNIAMYFENFINGAVKKFNSFLEFINGITSTFGLTVQTLPLVKVPRLAQGGLATSATPALIGEAGKEAVIPLERNQDNWAGLLASKLAEEFNNQDSMAERPITIVMNNTINNDMDTDEMCNKLTTALRRAV